MSNAEQLAATLIRCERSGIWYRSSDAANELRRLQAEVERLTAENAEIRKDADRYRWLRRGDYPINIARTILNDVPFGIDAAIDEAMKETP
jgi:hypothetical protein